MLDLYQTLWPVLRLLQPETAHSFAFKVLKLGLVPTAKGESDDPILTVRLWNHEFDNPIGLASGFDKEASAIFETLDLGFGFVEPGTVTPLPQSGNPKPRLFRLDEDNAAINRLGFNSGGLARFAGNIAAYRRSHSCGGPVGANIGRNKNSEDDAADYEISIEALAPLVDYLVINVSSPNTPGLRTMQRRETLEDLIARCLGARARAIKDATARPPLLVKIAPDLDDGELRTRTGLIPPPASDPSRQRCGGDLRHLHGLIGALHHRGPNAVKPAAQIVATRRGEGRAAQLLRVQAVGATLGRVLALR